jgi:phosphatidylglycerol---prolipoprotein diacylglyceryl transferase
MHPTLFHLGSLGFHSYGISIAVGFILAILLSVRAARRQGMSVERLLDLAFWILVSSLLGSRLLFLITEWRTYVDLCVGVGVTAPRGAGRLLFDCTRGLHLWEGGLVFYGGLLGATGASFIYTRRHRLPFLRVADLVVPVIALGHCIGRLGCFCAGCCYGKVTSAAWGVRFPTQSMAFKEMSEAHLLPAAATSTTPLHPTQLYESMAELCIYLLLVLIKPRKRYNGQLLAFYLGVYPVVRMIIELFRADPDRRYVVAFATPSLNRWLGLDPAAPSLLSTSQLVSLLCVAGAVALLVAARRRRLASP